MTLKFLLMIFFFNDTATTEIYTLSLHDALPISTSGSATVRGRARFSRRSGSTCGASRDRKSTRLNSSHGYISYAVFCLKKKTATFIVPTDRELVHAAIGIVIATAHSSYVHARVQ